MRGEVVTIWHSEEVSVDAFNKPVYEWQSESVDNVLVAVGTQADKIESNRLDGVEVKYTLYFPKTYTGSLLHAEVEVRSERLKVIGFPDRWNNCPTQWNMVCEVGVVNG